MKMIDEWITGNFPRMENFWTIWGDVKRIKFTYLLEIYFLIPIFFAEKQGKRANLQPSGGIKVCKLTGLFH